MNKEKTWITAVAVVACRFREGGQCGIRIMILLQQVLIYGDGWTEEYDRQRYNPVVSCQQIFRNHILISLSLSKIVTPLFLHWSILFISQYLFNKTTIIFSWCFIHCITGIQSVDNNLVIISLSYMLLQHLGNRHYRSCMYGISNPQGSVNVFKNPG